MSKTRVVITDDHEIFRNGLKLLLNNISDLEVVYEASNGKEFVDYIRNNPADLVFMDIKMPEMNGIEATKKAMEIKPGLKIIALTMFGESEYFDGMNRAGAMGFLLKKSDKEELEKAIDIVLNGETYLAPDLITDLRNSQKTTPNLPASTNVRLTRREKEVLHYICQGYSNHEIADILYVSKRTIDGHRNNLIQKTHSKNSISLVIFAIKNNLVQI